ncbi:cell envelope integrity protein TolA [Lysobacter koreensis]|uniref:Cell envelope integrity protein TolA n=1 Tax=Lysobacter koreensis TaxID=266122 RepID=A0ABW2YPR2_9GAMM
MRETRADTAQAFGLALALHALLFVVMFVGLWWTRSAAPAAAAGSMSAELFDSGSLSAAMQRTLRNRPEPAEEVLPEPQPEDAAPLPQPLPEPAPQDAPTPQQQAPQEFIPEPDSQDQDAVVDQPTPTPAIETRVQEAQRRQQQVDLTQQERQLEAERKQRLSQMEEQRQQQLADIRRRRALASRDAKVAEAQLQRIAQARAGSASEEAARADAGASAPAGNEGVDTGLQARYAAALQQAILSKWTRPETVPLGAPCRLSIRQLPGGEVMDVQVSSPCSYDEQGQESIKRAVLKAQPLPYAGFEAVFQRNLTLNFRAEDR